MRRDMELVRQILLSVESGDVKGNVEGCDKDTLNYHKAQLIDANLLKGKAHYSVATAMSDRRDIPDGVVIKGITWEGHDFIDAIRTDTKWMKVKVFLTEAGKDVTIETVKIAAKKLFGFD